MKFARKPAGQPELTFRSWGGARRGAGRKRKKGRRHVPHAARRRFPSRFPVHVTLRLVAGLRSLRSTALFPGVRERIRIAADRLGMRIVEFSVQGNHLHLVIEAEDWAALSRAAKGLSVRIARFVNKALGRRGRVFADRYHAHILETPREVRHALLYVLQNRKKDLVAAGRPVNPRWLDPCSSAPWFTGWRDAPPAPPRGRVNVIARVWLLTDGWKLRGLLRVDELPAGARLG